MALRILNGSCQVQRVFNRRQNDYDFWNQRQLLGNLRDFIDTGILYKIGHGSDHHHQVYFSQAEQVK